MMSCATICCNHRQTWIQQSRFQPLLMPIPAALDAYYSNRQHASLILQHQELCLGPERSVRMFDCATTGNATLACIRVEKSKFACNSVVLTKSNVKYWAVRVNAFSSHAPPSWEDSYPSEEANWAAQCSRVTFKMTVLAIPGRYRG
ncbi:TPA: hypothetical protein ACH3X1_001782 [Trebouxia sp. C0004]